MFRLKVISLLILLFAILLSSCAPGTNILQQEEISVSNALTQTAMPPATSTPVPGEATLPADASPTSTPGSVNPPTPIPILYQVLYQSPALGVQFSYPASWYRSELNGGVTLTSFDPSNPPHKLEWTDQTISMQFAYKVLITPPASFDAWVESAKQAALANGLSIYAEERFQLLFANQPAARLTLVSGSGGIIHQVLTELGERYFEINIEGNYDLAKAVLDSIQPSSEGVIKPPDSNTPAAGICGEPQGDPVNIVLGLDASGLPLAGRCIVVSPGQRIKLINQSVNPVKMSLMEYPITLLVGSELLLDRPVGQYLAFGVHSLSVGPELWVKENINTPPAVTAPPPIVQYSNPVVGYKLGLPGDWHVDENGITNGTNKEVIFYPPNAEPFVTYLSISLDFRTLDQIISFYAQNVPDAVREDTIFNGYTAVKYNYISDRNEYFVPYGNQIFLIASDRLNDGVVQSILMTVQFTTSSSTTYEATIMDNGNTFNIQVGDTLKLNLDPAYDWSAISVSDTNVIVATQGIYQARASGVATLTTAGHPKCLTSTPPCGMPSILFTITVIV